MLSYGCMLEEKMDQGEKCQAGAIVALTEILVRLEPIICAETYRFVTCPSETPDLPEGAIMAFKETEGWTYIVEERACLKGGLHGIFPSRKISLRVHSSLSAVGLLALLASRLSEAGISTNVVAGFHHDHFFVPAERAEEALALLRDAQEHAACTSLDD